MALRRMLPSEEASEKFVKARWDILCKGIDPLPSDLYYWKLDFWHMDKLNYANALKRKDIFCVKAVTADKLAGELAWLKKSDEWTPTDDGNLRFRGRSGSLTAGERSSVGFDKVMVMLWWTRKNFRSQCQGCLLHGDIDVVEAALAKKQKQWSKLLAELDSLAPEGKEVNFLRTWLKTITEKSG